MSTKRKASDEASSSSGKKTKSTPQVIVATFTVVGDEAVKRKIKLQGQTLADLHEALAKAFGYKTGPAHLYEIKVDKTVYYAPLYGKKSVADAALSSVKDGASLSYTFHDFGDDDLELQGKVESSTAAADGAEFNVAVLESAGDAPKQADEDDDEDDEDDDDDDEDEDEDEEEEEEEDDEDDEDEEEDDDSD
eukprot:TRINITY_DN2824_c0_g2_i1.p1 TRINITY_DN2824_c0_g2~~TRINITY_DN2824_c0_g2_i1.p1  ORF type:complete len:192 (+),score=86.99 TRINITY_DN2824_c0_g2_i1:92-667(+)